MSAKSNLNAYISGVLAPAVFGLVSLTLTGIAVAAPCTGPGAPSNTQTKCLTAIPITGSQLKSFDISYFNPQRNEYYLADRSTAGVDIIDTVHLVFVRTAGHDKPFTGLVLNAAGTGAVGSMSGPAGVVAHGRWLYAGDGNSTLHVIDLQAPAGSETKQVISTGGTLRVDEMDITTDGTRLLAANNADDPPFATLFLANGDAATSSVTALQTIHIDSKILPSGFGLGIEQPAWDPQTKRFYTSIPIIAENPPGCNYGQNSGPVTCSGGLLVTDPVNPTATQGLYNQGTNAGVIQLSGCGPNGATVGVNDNLLLGCTGGGIQQIINATTHNYAQVAGITGSDEVWFNAGDSRYYTGSSGQPKPAGSLLNRGSVLGVIDQTSVLIETIAQSSGSHSVAADSVRNLVFVPQTFTSAPDAKFLGDQNFTAGAGSPTVGQLICGTSDGCIAVYSRAPYVAPPLPPGGTPGTGPVTIVVNGPGATGTANTFATTSNQITLDASKTTTPNPNPTFAWASAPGYPSVGIIGANTATPSIQLSTRGTYQLTLTVTDVSGAAAMATVTIQY